MLQICAIIAISLTSLVWCELVVLDKYDETEIYVGSIIFDRIKELGPNFLHPSITARRNLTLLRMVLGPQVDTFVNQWSEGLSYPNLKEEPTDRVWIKQPVDWSPNDKTLLTDSRNFQKYHARNYYRFYASQRSKAMFPEVCFSQNSGIYTANKIVQLYYDIFEPYKFPCYSCDPRMLKNGRPKVFYILPDRNPFQVNNSDSPWISLYSHILPAMHKPKFRRHYNPGEVGLEWTIDQSVGPQFSSGGGDGIYVTPSRYRVDLTSFGSMACADGPLPGPERGWVPPDQTVVVSIDAVLTPNDLESSGFNGLLSVNNMHTHYKYEMYERGVEPDCKPLNESDDVNLVCLLTWQVWSCSNTCDDDMTKHHTRIRKGFVSWRKKNLLAPLKVDPSEVTRNKLLWFQIDAYFGTLPYARDGIPVHSTIWLKFWPVFKYLKTKFAFSFKNSRYGDVDEGPISCEAREICLQSKEENQLNIDHGSEEKFEPIIEIEPKKTKKTKKKVEISKSLCAADMFKHQAPILVRRKSSRLHLIGQMSYEFYCGNNKTENSKSKVRWIVGNKEIPGCQYGVGTFSRDNVMHVHSAEYGEFTYKCETAATHGTFRLYGVVTVIYGKSFDWRPFIYYSIVACVVIFPFIASCLWCKRKVSRATSHVISKATDAAIAAGRVGVRVAAAGADAMLGGVATNLVDQAEDAIQNRLDKNAFQKQQAEHKNLMKAVKRAQGKKAKKAKK